jgi:hypothetical protein
VCLLELAEPWVGLGRCQAQRLVPHVQPLVHLYRLLPARVSKNFSQLFVFKQFSAIRKENHFCKIFSIIHFKMKLTKSKDVT